MFFDHSNFGHKSNRIVLRLHLTYDDYDNVWHIDEFRTLENANRRRNNTTASRRLWRNELRKRLKSIRFIFSYTTKNSLHLDFTENFEFEYRLIMDVVLYLIPLASVYQILKEHLLTCVGRIRKGRRKKILWTAYDFADIETHTKMKT